MESKLFTPEDDPFPPFKNEEISPAPAAVSAGVGLVPQLVIDDLVEFFRNSKYRGETTARRYGGSIIIKFADGSKAKVSCSMWQGDEVTLDESAPGTPDVRELVDKNVIELSEWTDEGTGVWLNGAFIGYLKNGRRKNDEHEVDAR